MSDQELNDLLKAFDNPNHCYPQRLVDAIRLLVKERDDARRMICRLHFSSTEMQHDFAKAKGWDCYKEAK